MIGAEAIGTATIGSSATTDFTAHMTIADFSLDTLNSASNVVPASSSLKLDSSGTSSLSITDSSGFTLKVPDASYIIATNIDSSDFALSTSASLLFTASTKLTLGATAGTELGDVILPIVGTGFTLETFNVDWSATRPDRRKLVDQSLSDVIRRESADFVEIISIADSKVYVKEEIIEDVGALEFLVNDFENVVLSVAEDYNFRVESDRDLRMDLIEGETERRVSHYRPSGFNREEFAEEVEESDLEIGL